MRKAGSVPGHDNTVQKPKQQKSAKPERERLEQRERKTGGQGGGTGQRESTVRG